MTPFKGLVNLGNTCYLNAGLQMLIQNQDFYEIIKNNNNTNLLNIVSSFMDDYYLSNKQFTSPSMIKSIVQQKNSIFNGCTQNDAGEFIIYFLDILNDELLKNKNSLNELFEIQSEISIKCKIRACLNISSHIEKNNFLILNLNDLTKTLDDCYREYKAKIKLEDDTSYYCEKCKLKRVASKRLEIIKWPKHLIIWLKRFEHQETRIFKNNNELDIPLEWRHNYKLQGIVFHSGSLHGGHYVYVGKYNNEWFLYDDNSVSKINQNQLNNFKNYAYILYYIQ
jgi:ubiquitin C-terminal hydrolase